MSKTMSRNAAPASSGSLRYRAATSSARPIPAARPTRAAPAFVRSSLAAATDPLPSSMLAIEAAGSSSECSFPPPHRGACEQVSGALYHTQIQAGNAGEHRRRGKTAARAANFRGFGRIRGDRGIRFLKSRLISDGWKNRHPP